MPEPEKDVRIGDELTCCEYLPNHQRRVNCRVNSVSVGQQVVASCSGAVLTSLLMTPLDVVKIRLQQQHHPFPKGQCFFYHNGLMEHMCTACDLKKPCDWYQRPGNFSGTLDGLVKIAKYEGIASLWSGLTPTIVMALPATVFYFTIYDNLSALLRKRMSCRRVTHPNSWTPPDWVAATTAGAVARTISVTVVSPIEMIRTKVQSENMSYQEVKTAIRTSLESRGVRGFYLGWMPTILRDIPFSAYDFLKSRWRREGSSEFTLSFSCGAASGTVASLLTHPFDVVKTKSQVRMGSVGAEMRSSMTAIAKELYHSRGVSAFYSGIFPRTIKVAPSCAIMIGSYEYFKKMFKNRNSIND